MNPTVVIGLGNRFLSDEGIVSFRRTLTQAQETGDPQCYQRQDRDQQDDLCRCAAS